MSFIDLIRSFSGQPLTHQILMSLLKDYKRPNDKIHALLQDGTLEYIKKGLYISGPDFKANRPEPFLLANHILGPSYVSLDTALSHHGLIPERVYEVASMTTKASRKFQTPMGLFSYTRLPLPYYSFGIMRVEVADEQYAMIASPEKALCDKVITTSGLVLRNPKNAKNYLLEDLRMDEDNVKELDTDAMVAWLPSALKKESLLMLIKAVNNL
jgi:hypothetical protein